MNNEPLSEAKVDVVGRRYIVLRRSTGLHGDEQLTNGLQFRGSVQTLCYG